MKDEFIITIDGPAGAGKTTIAKMLAEKISDVIAIEELAENTEISFISDGGTMRIMLDGADVTARIRDRDVTDHTSLIAAIPAVRYKLARIQREAGNSLKKAVFEGRDMG